MTDNEIGLALLGGSGIAFAVVDVYSRPKPRPSFTSVPEQFTPTQEDWPLVPAAQRAYLFKKGWTAVPGASGRADVDWPQTPTPEMEKIDQYWRAIARRVDAHRSGEDRSDSPMANAEGRIAAGFVGEQGLTLRAHLERMTALKAKIFGRLTREGKPQYAPGILLDIADDWSFAQHGQELTTQQEIADFWNAIGKLANEAEAVLSWNPEEWNSLTRYFGENFAQLGKDLTTAVVTGAVSLLDAAGDAAGSLVWAVFKHPVFLVGAGVVGWLLLSGTFRGFGANLASNLTGGD